MDLPTAIIAFNNAVMGLLRLFWLFFRTYEDSNEYQLGDYRILIKDAGKRIEIRKKEQYEPVCFLSSRSLNTIHTLFRHYGLLILLIDEGKQKLTTYIQRLFTGYEMAKNAFSAYATAVELEE